MPALCLPDPLWEEAPNGLIRWRGIKYMGFDREGPSFLRPKHNSKSYVFRERGCWFWIFAVPCGGYWPTGNQPRYLDKQRGLLDVGLALAPPLSVHEPLSRRQRRKAPGVLNGETNSPASELSPTYGGNDFVVCHR